MFGKEEVRKAVQEIVPHVASQLGLALDATKTPVDFRSLVSKAFEPVRPMFVKEGRLNERRLYSNMLDWLELVTNPQTREVKPLYLELARNFALPLAFESKRDLKKESLRFAFIEELQECITSSLSKDKDVAQGVLTTLGVMLMESAGTQKEEHERAVFLYTTILSLAAWGLTPDSFKFVQFRSESRRAHGQVLADERVKKAGASYLIRAIDTKANPDVGGIVRLIEHLCLPNELHSAQLTNAAQAQVKREISKTSKTTFTARCIKIAEALPLLPRNSDGKISLFDTNKSTIGDIVTRGLQEVLASTDEKNEQSGRQFVEALAALSEDSLGLLTIADLFDAADVKALVVRLAKSIANSERSVHLLLQVSKRCGGNSVVKSCTTKLVDSIKEMLKVEFRKVEESFSSQHVQQLCAVVVACLAQGQEGNNREADPLFKLNSLLSTLKSLITSPVHASAYERVEFTICSAPEFRKVLANCHREVEKYFADQSKNFTYIELTNPENNPLTQLTALLRRVKKQFEEIKGISPFVDQFALELKISASAQLTAHSVSQLIKLLRSSEFGIVFPSVDTSVRFDTADAIACAAQYSPQKPIFTEDCYKAILRRERVGLHIQYGAYSSAQDLITKSLKWLNRKPHYFDKADYRQKLSLSLIGMLTHFPHDKLAAKDLSQIVVSFLQKFDNYGRDSEWMGSPLCRMTLRETIRRLSSALPEQDISRTLIDQVSILCQLSRVLERRVKEKTGDIRFVASVHGFEVSLTEIWFLLRKGKDAEVRGHLGAVEKFWTRLEKETEKIDRRNSGSLWHLVNAADAAINALISHEAVSQVNAQMSLAKVFRNDLRNLVGAIEEKVQTFYPDQSPLHHAVNMLWEKLTPGQE